MTVRWWSWRDRVVVVAALVLPLAVCALVVPFRTDLANTDAALVLVAAVVAVAAYGHRVAGLVASVSAGVCFDFFLTAPYERLSIADHGDAETFVLVLAVGAAVTELAVRGRRSRLLAVTDEQYLEAIRSTNAVVESKAGQSELTSHVCAQLTLLLGLRGCRFERNRFGGLPRLHSDGGVRDAVQDWDVDQHGMPESEIEITAAVSGRVYGRFVISPVAGVTPARAALRCAVIVVGQAAAALATYRQPV